MYEPQIEERIRRRAYDLWLAENGSHGRDLAHWAQAEREVLAEVGAEKKAATGSPAPKKKTSAMKAAPKKTAAKKASRPKKK
jgi:hypothetical protein